MHPHDLRIIFMGTPDFAAHSLKVLHESGYNIVAVVTMPDKPAGRGHKVQYSAVKQYALSASLPLLQPERLKDESFLSCLRSYDADLQIVVAFRMVPEVVWSMPRLGTFNLHASLLPQYRGAAPINWAVINGDKQTGVTTFFLRHEIDTGDIILQEKISIGEEEDAGSVHDRLMVLGAQMVSRTVDLIASGRATTTEQATLSEGPLKPAPKIFKETCLIDFTKDALEVHDFIRGLSPSPAAWCNIKIGEKEETVKLFATRLTSISRPADTPAGSVRLNLADKQMLIACNDRYLQVVELQFPGKRRMPIRDALNGYRL